MTIVYASSIRFVLQEGSSFDYYVVFRYEFEQWMRDDDIVTDQKLINKYEKIYDVWLKKQKVK